MSRYYVTLASERPRSPHTLSFDNLRDAMEEAEKLQTQHGVNYSVWGLDVLWTTKFMDEILED